MGWVQSGFGVELKAGSLPEVEVGFVGEGPDAIEVRSLEMREVLLTSDGREGCSLW